MISEITRVVPTIFPGFNRAITCGADDRQLGGYPLGTTGVVHGPAASGKTAFLLGLGMAFQRAGGMMAFVDAERVLHIPWVWRLGIDPERMLYFGRYHWADRTAKKKLEDMPPLYYEDVIVEVGGWIEQHIKAVQAGQHVGPLLIVVDSLKKLTPRGFTKSLDKKKGDVRGTALGREQAAFNTGWCAELGPKICDHDIAVVFVQHEGEGEVDNRGKVQMKLKGGQGIQYDASVILRMSFGSATYDLKAQDGQTNTSVGKKHRVTVEKNKIGPHRRGAASTFEYFISSGDGICPIGWDRPRELMNEGIRRGILGKAAKWDWSYSPTLGAPFMLGGRRHTLKQLYQDPELVDQLEGLLV